MCETRSMFRNVGAHPTRLRLSAGLGLAILLALACAITGRAQQPPGSSGGQGQGQGTTHSYSPHQEISGLSLTDMDPVMTQRRMLALNIQRQKQIVSDTDKLLKLTRELNQEVAQANTGKWTADELRKVAEIEKLARSVRQNMTEAAGQAPSLLPSMPLILNPN